MRFLALVAFLLTVQQLTSAQSCECPDFSGCGILNQGDVVFLGRVEEKKLGPEVRPGAARIAVISFSVQEAFKGVSDSELSVSTSEGGCCCGYSFKVGESYVLFAKRSAGGLTTSACLPNREFHRAAALVQQLRAQQSGNSAATLFGVVEHVNDRKAGSIEYVHLPGAMVELSGDNGQRYFTQTDPDGAYEFLTLPAQTYRVSAAAPQGLATWSRITSRPVEVTITSQSNCSQDIGMFYSGRIKGRVLDDLGRSRAGFISAESIDTTETAHGSDVSRTGEFDIPGMWPGKFHLRYYPFRKSQLIQAEMSCESGIVDLAEGQRIDIELNCTTVISSAARENQAYRNAPRQDQ